MKEDTKCNGKEANKYRKVYETKTLYLKTVGGSFNFFSKFKIEFICYFHLENNLAFDAGHFVVLHFIIIDPLRHCVFGTCLLVIFILFSCFVEEVGMKPIKDFPASFKIQMMLSVLEYL